MINHQIETWTNFKAEVSNRNMYPQWLDSNGSYYIYAKDGFLCFSCEIKKENPVSADQTDFETNYKSIWNTQLEYRDSKGLNRVHVSPRPNNTETYFAGAGDSGGIGNGNQLIFNLSNTDVSKSVDLTYSENVFMKDGVIRFTNAPLGSYLDLEIVHPVAGVIGSYARKLHLLGDGRIDVNSEDYAEITAGLIVRISVYNSNGTGEQDPASNFKVCGFLEMYRTNTV